MLSHSSQLLHCRLSVNWMAPLALTLCHRCIRGWCSIIGHPTSWRPAGHPVFWAWRALHQPVDGRAADSSPNDPHPLHEWQAGAAEHGLVGGAAADGGG